MGLGDNTPDDIQVGAHGVGSSFGNGGTAFTCGTTATDCTP
jgi:hypothetical protein